MCGIAALFQPGRRFDPDMLSGIEDDLYHRGPDSGGVVEEAGAALVFRRLAIIDPHGRSDQPMTDPSGRVTLVFNGEIYNYRALRRELETAGVRLRTQGDTETILEGYLRWGVEVLDRLEGMYALCILDRHTGRALIARDPLGIKPLYLLRQGDLTAVASEVRPLLRLRPAEVDPQALPELFTFGWAAGRLSNYRGIDRLPGGTVVEVDLQNGAVKERRFCDPLDTLAQSDPVEEADVQEAVTNSVRAHLVSDVGYALQLSGGVDSSLIAALALTNEQKTINSYSVGLKGHPYDEKAYQDMVVSRYKTNHHRANITAEDYADALPSAVRHMEGPTPHGGCTMLMILCGRVREDCKVVLTGEGADEMFGGYQRYAIWRKLAGQEMLARWTPDWATPDVWPFKGANRLRGVDAAAYASVYHDFRSLQRIFPGLIPAPGAREATSGRFSDFRDRLLAVDQSAYLESLLVRQDKMSMAQSVEARVPFTHIPLLRKVNGMRHSDRLPGGETKPVLKRMAERYLPRELIHRRKIGLWLPYQDWFADPDGAGRHVELLRDPDSRLAAYGERSALHALLDRAVGGERSSGLILQRLVELELWLRDVDGQPAQ